MAKSTDKRIQLLSQLVTCLFLVKVSLWENLYVEAVGAARRYVEYLNKYLGKVKRKI